MSDGLDWDELRRVHAAESEERLSTMESAILDLERDPTNPEPIEALQRDTHTLKGNAGIFGFDSIAQLAHAFEDALATIKKGILTQRPVERGAIGLLLRGVDAFRSGLPTARPGVEMSAAEQALTARLRSLGSAAPPAFDAVAAAGSKPHRRASDLIEEARAARPTLRVDAARVDSLVELASELSVSAGRMANALAEGGVSEQTRDVLEEAIPLLAQLSDLAMRMRLVPLGPILASHRRTARDSALRAGKEVLLHTTGDEVEVDLALVDRISEALVHLVRNAVAHGIETPEERRKKGKGEVGRVTLAAKPSAGQVVIEVSDDGAGLDLHAIRSRAAALGIPVPPSDNDAAQLIFSAGLSTAIELSETAGRGVGLDAVKASIESLAGSLEVHSKADEGTLFRVRLPLTLAMIRGLLVQVGAHRFIIPIDLVGECMAAPKSLPFQPNGAGVLQHGQTMLPVLRLGEQILGRAGDTDAHIVVVEHSGQRLGLVVDALVADTPVVIKSIGRALKSATSIFGAAVLGDGTIGLILDIPDIMRRTLAQRTSPSSSYQKR